MCQVFVLLSRIQRDTKGDLKLAAAQADFGEFSSLKRVAKTNIRAHKLKSGKFQD